MAQREAYKPLVLNFNVAGLEKNKTGELRPYELPAIFCSQHLAVAVLHNYTALTCCCFLKSINSAKN